jgi:hypothetical protein
MPGLPNMRSARLFHEIGKSRDTVDKCCAEATADALLRCGKMKRKRPGIAARPSFVQSL